ncbi:beta-lactam-binding protein with PASTA domain [Bacilli bacterium PM5-9]|nr:beta-lactam-binding protein with PASTA domain [Bacilli bacterium PM5-9]
MSDFLNKFEDENYDGKSIISNDFSSEKINDKPLFNSDETYQNKTVNNSVINEQVTSVKKDAIMQNNDVNNDEIIVKDVNYSKNQRKRKILLIIGGIASLILIALIVLMINIVKVPNLVDKDLSQVKSWAKEANVNLIVEKKYSNKYDENIVLKQEKKKGSHILKKSNFEIVVSKGADPEEKIEVPNLMYMDISEINEWISDNKLDNVELKAVYSKTYPKDKVMSISYEGDFVSASNYHRQDAMIIKVSKGKASLTKNIVVPDFKTTDKYEVQDWAQEYGITVNYYYSTHPKKVKNAIIKQSIKKGEKMSQSQSLSVTVSLGKSVKVPDFSKMTKASASSYSSIKVSVKSKYDSKVKYGKLISQSIQAGTYVTSSQKINVTYSEGKPFIDDITGYTQKDVEKYFYNLNLKGAKLKYKIIKETSNNKELLKNSVLRTSIQNDYAKIGATIKVYIKKN